MKNTVTISVEFSFKGQTLSPSMTIDLDEVMQSTGHLPSFYQLLASKNGFDLYSYEYEMMQAEPIHYADAQGLVSRFITDGELDIATFETAWHEHQVVGQLRELADRTMGIENFDENPELQQALYDAYLLGQKSRS